MANEFGTNGGMGIVATDAHAISRKLRSLAGLWAPLFFRGVCRPCTSDAGRCSCVTVGYICVRRALFATCVSGHL